VRVLAGIGMPDEIRTADIEARRGSEHSLGNAFEAAFRATEMAMVLTDPNKSDNPIVFANDAFARLTGFPREEVVGRNCRFLQGPDTNGATVRELHAAIKAGESAEVEILNYQKDGKPFWNALVINPIRNGAGELVYFFASQCDISAKKQTEMELIRAKALLEQQVSGRTRELQVALDQKTALLHEVDHRVKNSLQVISSLVLLNARRAKEDSAKRVLHSLSERISAISTAHRLLYSVGDVSRFDLAEFLTDLAGDFGTLVPAGRVRLDLRIEPVAVAAAKAAPLALLANELISNAFKHAYPGERSGKLLIAVTRLGRDLRIVIEDDGAGLPDLALLHDGFGKILIDMLVRQLKAQLEWEDARPGTRAVIVMPLDKDEAQF
jgi:PAS domain S-box-containing protein